LVKERTNLHGLARVPLRRALARGATGFHAFGALAASRRECVY
jgi:hypothetical protein